MKKIICLIGLFFGSAYSLSEKEASIIASDFINSISKEIIISWQKAKPEDPFLYYNQNDEPFMWCFEIKKKNKELGFLMLEAKNGIVREFSTSIPPHKWNIEPARKRAEECINKGQIIGAPHFIWLDISLYLIQFPVIENNKITKITINLKTNEVVSSGIPPFSNEVISYGTKREVSKIEFKLNSIVRYNLYISEMVTNISSLLLYYQNKGILKGKKPLSFKDVADGLSEAGCDCEPIKTTNRFLTKLGYKVDGKVSPYVFEELKREIDKRKPAILTIEAGGIKHSLLARGYLKTEFSNWLVLNDPFSNGLSFYCLNPSKFHRFNLITMNIQKEDK